VQLESCSLCAFDLATDPAAQAYALDCRSQGRFTVQFGFGADQYLSVERAVGLLAGLGAKLQVAVLLSRKARSSSVAVLPSK